MTDESKRTQSARAHDDRELIENMEPGPGQGGVSGGNLQREVAARAEQEHAAGGEEEAGVTRVHGSDEKEGADLPRSNQR